MWVVHRVSNVAAPGRPSAPLLCGNNVWVVQHVTAAATMRWAFGCLPAFQRPAMVQQCVGGSFVAAGAAMWVGGLLAFLRPASGCKTYGYMTAVRRSSALPIINNGGRRLN